jgi:PAS domain S-box-containing protein/putative nucleotidyltransferase with HDIG domain
MTSVAVRDDQVFGAEQFLAAPCAWSDVAIIGKTLDGLVLFWNAGAERLYGYTAAEMLGHGLAVLFPPDRPDELSELLTRARQGETARNLQTERLRKDGRRVAVSITVSPVVGPDGAVVGVSTIGHDLTEYVRNMGEARRLQRSAAEAPSLLKTLLATAPVGLGFVDRQFRIVHTNETLAAVNGSAVQDQIGRTVAELRPTIWPQVEAIYRQVVARGEAVVNVEVSGEIAAEPGRLHHWLASYYPVRLDGEVIGVGLVVVDITERKHSEQAHDELTRSAVAAIAATAEARDPYTAGHQRRVADLSAVIATELGLDDDNVNGIRVAATIHDIGKVTVPAEILIRPGKLRPLEWEMVKEHSRAGYEIVQDIAFPWPVAEMILQHHERLDGSGYPDGLRDEQIMLGARIIAVADTVEAMASHRPYRAALGLRAALDEIKRGSGSLFDPPVVEACLQLFRDGRLSLDAHDFVQLNGIGPCALAPLDRDLP